MGWSIFDQCVWLHALTERVGDHFASILFLLRIGLSLSKTSSKHHHHHHTHHISLSFPLSQFHKHKRSNQFHDRCFCYLWVDLVNYLMVMGELTQTEVYSPRTHQVWKSLLSWFAFFFQIFFQFIRAFGHHTLLSSSSSSSSSSSPSFKPLPSVELQDYDSSSPPPSALEITAADSSTSDHRPVHKLTVTTSAYFIVFLV